MDLQQAVTGLAYKPGWSFRIESGWTSSTGAVNWLDEQPAPSTATAAVTMTALLGVPQRLMIAAYVPDSRTGRPILAEHRFHIPAAHPLNPGPPGCPSWERWLLDRILDVERHEAMEYFTVTGHRLFYPEHGPDGRLYDIIERPAPAGKLACLDCQIQRKMELCTWKPYVRIRVTP